MFIALFKNVIISNKFRASLDINLSLSFFYFFFINILKHNFSLNYFLLFYYNLFFVFYYLKNCFDFVKINKYLMFFITLKLNYFCLFFFNFVFKKFEMNYFNYFYNQYFYYFLNSFNLLSRIHNLYDFTLSRSLILNAFSNYKGLKLINKNLKYYYCFLKTKNINLEFISFFSRFNSFLLLKTLYDISAVDFPNRLNRFELYYSLVSIYLNIRVFFKYSISEYLEIFSWSKYFSSANWLEREVWDLYGIFFYNHPNLRRILTDYGFRGFPFRKDFPLSGYVEVRFDDETFSVVYEPLELTQEFRLFTFRSPWESFVIK